MAGIHIPRTNTENAWRCTVAPSSSSRYVQTTRKNCNIPNIMFLYIFIRLIFLSINDCVSKHVPSKIMKNIHSTFFMLTCTKYERISYILYSALFKYTFEY